MVRYRVYHSVTGGGGGYPRRRRLFRIWMGLLLLSLGGVFFLYAYLRDLVDGDLQGGLINLNPNSKAVDGKQLPFLKTPSTIFFDYLFGFSFPESWRQEQLMVDLPGKCQIPAIEPWSEDIRLQLYRKILPKLNCNQISPRISYIQDNKIFLDLKLLEVDEGAAASCCYKSIHRITQSSLQNYNESADNGFIYSKSCEPMSSAHPTIPHSMFVKVECKVSNNAPSGPILYEKFHAVALLPPAPPPPVPPPSPRSNPNDDPAEEAKEEEDEDEEMDVDVSTSSSRVGAIVDFWELCSKQLPLHLHTGNNVVGQLTEREQRLCAGFRTTVASPRPPPNVLLLGIDSTSRLNFRRWMSKTVAFLEGIGAVEMLGYNKVGENTFPNLVPMLMSLSEEELKSTCARDSSDPLDDCPLIWKDFSSLSYLTAHLEDDPKGQIFNNFRIGFVSPPVDIYLRPFIQALYEKGLSEPHCDGYESLEELMLNFAVDIMTTASSKGRSIPTFISIWMTDLTHDDHNGIQQLDELFYGALRKLEQVGILSNTLVFLVGDHGYNYLPVRNTLSGHFEVKLPALWIHLPETVRASNPDWMPNLELNRITLATPYDVHATLLHILTSVNSEYKKAHVSREETPEQQWGLLKEEEEEEEAKGKSLLRPLPDRNCEEAHIPKEFCSCEPPVRYEEDEEMIGIAVNATVEYINSRLPAVCRPLFVSTVFYSGLVRGSPKKQPPSCTPPPPPPPPSGKPQEGDVLVLGIMAYPGGIKLEVLLAFDNNSSAFTNVTSTLRTNALVARDIGCLKGEVGFSRGRCFCAESEN